MMASNGGADPVAIESMLGMGIEKEHVIACLKASNNNVERATEYYFGAYEMGQKKQQTDSNWDDSMFDSDRNGWTNDVMEPTPRHPPMMMLQQFEDPKGAKTRNTSPAPMIGDDDDPDIRAAIALSLGQEAPQPPPLPNYQVYGPQQSGVVTGGNYTETSEFKAVDPNKQHDSDQWAAVPYQQVEEVIEDPPAPQRKKYEDDPVFLRQSPNAQNLGPLLTILHSIPTVREFFLQRDMVLNNYGKNENWWHGEEIRLPTVTSIDDVDDDYVQEAKNLVIETQRIMAFLDASERAYGTAESIGNMKNIKHWDNAAAEIVDFYREWHDAPHHLSQKEFDPDLLLDIPNNSNPHKIPFQSVAIRRNRANSAINETKFACMELVAPKALVERHGTLYDALDGTVWEEEADENVEVFLKSVADVVSLLVKKEEDNGFGCGLEIPPALYLDRYTEPFLEHIRDLKRDRYKLEAQVKEYEDKEVLLTKFTGTGPQAAKGPFDMTKLIASTIDHFSKPWPNAINGADGEIAYTPPQAPADIVSKLKAIEGKISKKLEVHRAQKEEAREALLKLRAVYTTPETCPPEKQLRKLRLRGFTNDPSTSYLLRKIHKIDPLEGKAEKDLMEMVEPDETMASTSTSVLEWQWWRMCFNRAQGIASFNMSDNYHASFEVKKVTEEEALQAAKGEGKGPLTLIYAADTVDDIERKPLPEALAKFVQCDNEFFAAEIEEASNTRPSHKRIRFSEYNGSDSRRATPGSSRRNSATEDFMNESTGTLMPMPDLPPPPPPGYEDQEMMDFTTPLIDKTIDEDAGPSLVPSSGHAFEVHHEAAQHVEYADTSTSNSTIRGSESPQKQLLGLDGQATGLSSPLMHGMNFDERGSSPFKSVPSQREMDLDN